MLAWTYGVMVSTLDFESNNPSSNLGMSSFLFFTSSSRDETQHGCSHNLLINGVIKSELSFNPEGID